MVLRLSWWIGVFSLSLYGLKQYSNGCWCTTDSSLDGKVILITGGTSGLGKEAACNLAARGGRVYITARTEESGARAAAEIQNSTGVAVTPLVLELSSLASVRCLVTQIRSRESKLDILISNAGVFFKEGRTQDGFEYQLGHFLLTHLLMEPLLASGSGRVITVTSFFHALGAMNWEDMNNEAGSMDQIQTYAQSKIAGILFTRELARRLKDSPVAAYVVHPGVVYSSILRHFPLQDWWLGRALTFLVTWPFIKDTQHGVQTTVSCAVDPGSTLVSGMYYADCMEKEPAALATSDDDALKLWQQSVRMLNMSAADIHQSLR